MSNVLLLESRRRSAAALLRSIQHAYAKRLQGAVAISALLGALGCDAVPVPAQRANDGPIRASRAPLIVATVEGDLEPFDLETAPWGAAIALSAESSHVMVGGPSDRPRQTSSGMVTIFSRPDGLQDWRYEANVYDPDGADGDEYGAAIALTADGRRALIGVPGDNGTGSVRVLLRDGETWTVEGTLEPAAATAGDRFGAAVAISAEGDIAVIGAPFADTEAGEDSGRVAVFTRSGSTWTLQDEPTANEAAAGDRFGASVALHAGGSHALIGVPYDDTEAGTDAGSARVLVRNGADWSEQTTLLLDNAAANDHFGSAVALDATAERALIGAPDDDGPIDGNAGSAQAFERSGSVWTAGRLMRSATPTGGDRFGAAVALSGDGEVAHIGVPGDNVDVPNELGGTDNVIDAGSVQVFQPSDDSNSALLTRTALYPFAGQAFGSSIAISTEGEPSVVGSPQATRAELASFGQIWIFDHGLLSSEPIEVHRPPVTDFGFSIAPSVDGSRVLIGAPGMFEALLMSYGHAYVFVQNGGTWQPEAVLIPSDRDFGDLFGFATAISEDGSLALISAITDDVGDVPEAGSVRVFSRTGSSWSELTTLIDATPEPYEGYGCSLSMTPDASRIVVSTCPHDITAQNQLPSFATVLRREGDSWIEEAAFEQGFYLQEIAITAAGDRIALSGLVLRRSGTTWNEEATLDTAAPVRTSISADGTQLLMGYEVLAREGVMWSPRELKPVPMFEELTLEPMTMSADGLHLIAAFVENTGEQVSLLYGRVDDEWFPIGAMPDQEIATPGNYPRLCADSSHSFLPVGPSFRSGTVRVHALSIESDGLGGECLSGVTCDSGFCVDGVCCENDCGGGNPDDCMFCASRFTGLANGSCGPVAANLAGQIECRAADAACNAAETCTPDSTECPPDTEPARKGKLCRSQSCSNDAEISPSMCDGESTVCPASETKSCGEYVCGGIYCNRNCMTDADCASDDYCDLSRNWCEPRAGGASGSGANDGGGGSSGSGNAGSNGGEPSEGSSGSHAEDRDAGLDSDAASDEIHPHVNLNKPEPESGCGCNLAQRSSARASFSLLLGLSWLLAARGRKRRARAQRYL